MEHHSITPKPCGNRVAPMGSKRSARSFGRQRGTRTPVKSVNGDSTTASSKGSHEGYGVSPREAVLYGTFLLLALGVALGVGFGLRALQMAEAEREFHVVTDSVVLAFHASLNTVASSVCTVSDTLEAFPEASFSQFLMATNTVAHSTEIATVDFVPLVPDSEQRRAWEQAVSDHLSEEHVFLRANGSSQPVPHDGTPPYYPVTYQNPIPSNTDNILLDLATSDVHGDAIMQAEATRGLVVSDPIVLESSASPDSNTGVLLFSPIGNHTCGSRHNQSCDLRGFAVLELHMESLFTRALADLVHLHVNARLVGPTQPVFVAELGQHVRMLPLDTTPSGRFSYQEPVPFANQRYTIHITSTPTHEPSRWKAWSAAVTVLSIQIVVLVTVALDRTRKRAAKQMARYHAHRAQAKDMEAQATSAAHSRIVGFLCHELRNPLHVLETWFKVLDPMQPDTEGPPEDLAAVSADVQYALAAMRRTVNDVLDFRRMSAGAFVPDVTPADAYDEMCTTVARCRAFIPASLAYRVSCRCPEKSYIAELDVPRLVQAVTNGLSNAGKCTPSGSVSVAIGFVEDSAVEAASNSAASSRFEPVRFLVVDVANTGTGLPADPTTLFTPFSKHSAAAGAKSTWGMTPPPGHEDRCRQLIHRWHTVRASLQFEDVDSRETAVMTAVNTSTGLGLPLSRAFALASGGWADLEDEPRGADGTIVTHFIVLVPAPLPGAATPGAYSRRVSCSTYGIMEEDAVDLSTATVLVVDDETANRRVLERQLKRAGVPKESIVSFAGGREAVNAFPDHTGRPNTVCFLDINMPGLTGLEVMRYHTPPFPVIATTGNVDAAACDDYHGAGFAAVLAKPFDVFNVTTVLSVALTNAPFQVVRKM